jgi:hypothetical protein
MPGQPSGPAKEAPISVSSVINGRKTWPHYGRPHLRRRGRQCESALARMDAVARAAGVKERMVTQGNGSSAASGFAHAGIIDGLERGVCLQLVSRVLRQSSGMCAAHV